MHNICFGIIFIIENILNEYIVFTKNEFWKGI